MYSTHICIYTKCIPLYFEAHCNTVSYWQVHLQYYLHITELMQHTATILNTHATTLCWEYVIQHCELNICEPCFPSVSPSRPAHHGVTATRHVIRIATHTFPFSPPSPPPPSLLPPSIARPLFPCRSRSLILLEVHFQEIQGSRIFIAQCCSVLQCVAVCCSVLRDSVMCRSCWRYSWDIGLANNTVCWIFVSPVSQVYLHRDLRITEWLQRITTYVLQHTASHGDAYSRALYLKYVSNKTCTSLSRATHCNTLQHIATHCNTLQLCAMNICEPCISWKRTSNKTWTSLTCCNMLQHTQTATRCNTVWWILASLVLQM